MTIGKVIRIARTIKGYGQSDLAKQAGLVGCHCFKHRERGEKPQHDKPQ